jgi:hypothetical protein
LTGSIFYIYDEVDGCDYGVMMIMITCICIPTYNIMVRHKDCKITRSRASY